MVLLRFNNFLKINENVNLNKSLSGMSKFGIDFHGLPSDLVSFMFKHNWIYKEDRKFFTYKELFKYNYAYVLIQDDVPTFRIDGEVSIVCDTIEDIKKFIVNIEDINYMIEKIDDEEDWTEEEKEEGVRDNLKDKWNINSQNFFIAY